jgi:cell division protein FtsI (penicillin-binding protein 3)
VIYAPSGGLYYGGAVSLPVFKEIADKVYSNHLDLHDALTASQPSKGNNNQTLPAIKKGNEKDLNKILAKLDIEIAERMVATSTPVQKRGAMLIVPNVVGMGIRDALYILENSGLNVQTNGKGMVTKQSLDPGTKILKGQKITIQLG